MCGIFVSICKTDAGDSPGKGFLISKIVRRGPDSHSTVTVKSGSFTIQFTSSVLFIRGDSLSHQPITLSDGSILMFNGEIFDVSPDSGLKLAAETSDTQLLAELLDNERDRFPRVLSSINGPYALVFFDKSSQKLWYGRDIVGRRSLCRHVSPDGHLVLCSVCPSPHGWEEVTTEGIHCIDLSDGDLDGSCWTWSHSVAGRKNNTPLSTTIHTCIPLTLYSIGDIEEASEELGRILSSAVRKRVLLRRNQAKVAILFSGGIDSTVIAALAHQHLPADESIDLINVAFADDAPDRLTAIRGYETLSSLCSSRPFRLVLVTPSKYDLALHRSQEIKYLIYPLQTVLDDSVGCALWFASRANGLIYPCNTPCKSSATILLHGLGADELMAGYTRHRRVYDTCKKSYQALQDELNMDLERIHCRNLGRDDRIVSDHGKEVRFPFLDEKVIGLLNNLPVHLKCNLDEPRGFGEKKLLRHLAMSLGLGKISNTEKRAMQFGSRIAKLEQTKESASMQCSRLDL